MPGKRWHILVAAEAAAAEQAKEWLEDGRESFFSLENVSSWMQALTALTANRHDAALVGERLDGRSGLDLLRMARGQGCHMPVVILTETNGGRADHEAMEAGAADFVALAESNRLLLERALIHAVERHQILDRLERMVEERTAEMSSAVAALRHVVSARERTEGDLKRQRNFLDTVINLLPQAVYAKDVNGRFILANRRHAALLGFEDPSEVVGRTDAEVMPPERARIAAQEDGLILRGERECIETTSEERDPVSRKLIRYLHVVKLPLRDAAGSVMGLVGLQVDLTEHRRMEEQLRETEERYRLMFEQAADGIMLVDPDGWRIVDFNERACEMLGYSRNEFAQLTLCDVEASRCRNCDGRLTDCLASSRDGTVECACRMPAGEIRYMTISARPLTIRGRDLLHLSWRDVTERKRMEESLREAVGRLKQNDEAKTEFVSNVSHELKTPITAMMYGARNLLRGIAGPLPEEVLHYLRMFERECQRMVGTVNDILDLRKLDANAVDLNPVVVPLVRLAGRAVEMLRLHAEAKQLAVNLKAEKGAGFVRCDPEKIERVMLNVLGNAVKFTPPGGRLNVLVKRDDGTDSYGVVVVEDSGIGIPPEALRRVTERYFRAHSHASGSGLGLAISKEILRLHGGKMEIQSPPPGQASGTQVVVRLPAASPPVVLAVDDDPQILQLLAMQLRSYGYEVVTAENGKDAIVKAETHRPQAIILDLILGDTHGCDVIFSLKSRPEMRRIAIVAVTGGNLTVDRSEVLRQFGIPSLAKPWREVELLDQMESALMGMAVLPQGGDDTKEGGAV